MKPPMEQTSQAPRPAQPPQPPQLPRALRLTTVQRFGLPILFAIPLLALFGLFGERYADARAAGHNLSADVHYPSLLHYRQPLAFRLSVQNTGATAADSIIVTFGPEFMRAFTAAQMAPPFQGPYSVSLRNVRAGESQIVTGTVSGDKYWRNNTWVRITGPDGELQIPLSAFVYP